MTSFRNIQGDIYCIEERNIVESLAARLRHSEAEAAVGIARWRHFFSFPSSPDENECSTPSFLLSLAPAAILFPLPFFYQDHAAIGKICQRKKTLFFWTMI